MTKTLRFLSAAGLAAVLASCSTMDTLVQKASGVAADKGYISQKQAASVQKTSTAFRKSAAEISESEEYYIGRAVAAQILSRYKPLEDDGVNDYLQSVAQSVAIASDRPVTFKGYHVQALDSDEVNAFAAPGGFIFLTRGLLKKCASEDQLAGVLAHELAHVSQKHGLKTISAARLTSAFTILGTEAVKNYTSDQVGKLTEAFEGSIDDIVNKLVVNGYSRDKEFEADHFGATFASRANYDPGALSKVISGLEGVAGNAGLGKTHPDPGARLAELAKYNIQPTSDYRSSTARQQRFSAAMGSL